MTERTQRSIPRVAIAVCTLAGLAAVLVAGAGGAVYNDDCLPPPFSAYRATAPLQFQTAIGTVQLATFRLSSLTTPCGRLPKAGTTETVTYDALLKADLSINGGAPEDATTTARLTQLNILQTRSGKTKTYTLELTQLTALDLPQNLDLRESPSSSSTGTATITGAPKGAANIEGSIAVFTDLSTDGGTSWIPATGGATSFVLEPDS